MITSRFTYIIFVFLFLRPLWAQLSPGDLHRSHAELEGIANCTRCHERGKKLSSAKCLDCHQLLAARMRDGKGLHARPEYKQCADCHVEHLGRDYDLIYWKGGKKGFDHSLTGYKLEGKHASLDCRDCHRSDHIADAKSFQKYKKDLKRTFLGLDRQCLSCHHDEHRGQLKADCLSCHTMSAWKPADKFDHDKTRFPLTGLHKTTNCAKCHPRQKDNKFKNDDSFLTFSKRKFSRCSDCHSDVHRGRFGKNCRSCHNTGGWHKGALAGFDHNKTDYPLSGKHRQLVCSDCHTRGQPLRIARFQRCTDCHRDYHLGRFAHRPQKGACEECHTVEGFSPANFTLDQHQKTKYPLKGAHQAVPCIFCHKKVQLKNGRPANRFYFPSFRCTVCHKDPHRGEVDAILKQTAAGGGQSGCANCHNVDSWSQIGFDHSRTGFPLQGRHSEIGCKSCHQAAGTRQISFHRLEKDCASCHKDTHAGQFAGNGQDGKTDCARCHRPENWQALNFDHEQMSRFSLKGAHRRVDCKACHKTETVNGTETARYKPLPLKCIDCHKAKKT